ncbi:MAG TPA: PIN domain-containing protein [Solirubrobacterales bacterium]|nr:PIN domain-containing protein [Solirubrobacterales bacterium]
MTAEPFGPGIPLVIDASAWSRQRKPAVQARWNATNDADLFASCPVAALEILKTARDERDFAEADAAFSAIPQVPITASACRAALTAARELRGSRRLPVADYLIAAAAAERGFGVLHADRHFDLLATVLEFESVRLPD